MLISALPGNLDPADDDGGGTRALYGKMATFALVLSSASHQNGELAQFSAGVASLLPGQQDTPGSRIRVYEAIKVFRETSPNVAKNNQ